MLECVRAKGKAGSSGAAKADAQEGVEEASGMRPRLLAMDCEMCETDREQAALVGLCVSDEKGDVLYKVRLQMLGHGGLGGWEGGGMSHKGACWRSCARLACRGWAAQSGAVCMGVGAVGGRPLQAPE